MSYVTAYVDISTYNQELGYSKCLRNKEAYLNAGTQLLSKNIDLIVFIEPAMEATVMKIRESYGLRDKTKLIPFKITDSPYFKYYQQLDQIWKQGKQPYPTMHVDTPLYLIVIWTKFYWMKLASEMTDHELCWIDFGLANGFGLHLDMKRLFTTCPNNKIKIARTKNDYHHDHDTAYKEHHRSILASIMLGSNETWKSVCCIFEQEVEYAMERSYPVYEETILTWLDVQGHVLSHWVGTHICAHLFNDRLTDVPPLLILQESMALRNKGYHNQAYNCVHQVYTAYMDGLYNLSVNDLILVMDEIIINGYYANQDVRVVAVHMSKLNGLTEQQLKNISYIIP